MSDAQFTEVLHLLATTVDKFGGTVVLKQRDLKKTHGKRIEIEPLSNGRVKIRISGGDGHPRGVTEQRLQPGLGRKVHPAAQRNQGPTGFGSGGADEAQVAAPVGEADGSWGFLAKGTPGPHVAGTQARRPPISLGRAA